MDFISCYVREAWHYKAEELKRCFSLESKEEFQAFVKTLMLRRVLVCLKFSKEKKNYDTEEEEIISALNDDEYTKDNAIYSFKFVGIAIYKNRIIYAYPKYVGSGECLPKKEPVEHLRKVIRIINKYSAEKVKQDVHDIDFFVDVERGKTVNLLAVIFFLLEDYASYGLYEKGETVLESNGDGEIYWQKTIDETYPIIQDNRPYYVECYTLKNTHDEQDYIRRLHAYVIKQCAKKIKDAKLGEFLSLPRVEVMEMDGDDFSDLPYVLRRLELEMHDVFEDRKLLLLKALYAYLTNCGVLTGENAIQLIGTRSFNLVWEWVCAKVFRTQKNELVNELKPGPVIDYDNLQFKKPPTLVELIEKPKWVIVDKGQHALSVDKTIEPDYLGFVKEDPSYIFYILDAKYYCPTYENGKIFGQPGVEDIVKQYVYYYAYADILKNHNVEKVKNYFLMPKRIGDNAISGSATLDMLKKYELSSIEIRTLDTNIMYERCLADANVLLGDLDREDSEVRTGIKEDKVIRLSQKKEDDVFEYGMVAEPSKPDGQVEYRPAGAKDEKKYSQRGKKKK